MLILSLIIIVTSKILIGCSLTPEGRKPANTPPQYNVIFVTLDGVRWEEFFDIKKDTLFRSKNKQERLMENFWEKYAEQGLIWGNRDENKTMEISNRTRVSLPGYQSIFAGYERVDCKNNHCGQIQVPTLFSSLKEQWGDEVPMAVFSRWWRIAEAVSPELGQIPGHYGNKYQYGGDFFDYRPGAKVDLGPFQGPTTWKETFWDAVTMDKALQYLEQKRPRFLYISLGEADEYGHQYNKQGYLQAIKDSDQHIDQLIQTVSEMSGYGENTWIIITTDHGRGKSHWLRSWANHGPFKAAKYVWMYVRPPLGDQSLIPQIESGRTLYHGHIRPTIEDLLDLAPRECSGDECFPSLLKKN